MTYLIPDGTVVPDMLATPEQFTEFCNTRGASVPANAGTLLRGCTTLVLDASSGAWYDTDDTTGLPTSTLIAAALADATCIQALAWSKLGIDPDTGGVVTAGIKTAKGIGSARVSYADVAEAAAARAAAVSGLVPSAVARLRQLNLIDSSAWGIG